MSLQAKILSLLSGITDPALRMDIASTINFFSQLYESGEVDENRIRNELWEVCFNVIRSMHPEMTDAEAKEQARKLEDEFIRIFRVETTRRRVLLRLRRAREYTA